MTKEEIQELLSKASGEVKGEFTSKSEEIKQEFDKKAEEITEAIKGKASENEVTELKEKLNSLGLQYDEMVLSLKQKQGTQIKGFDEVVGEKLAANKKHFEEMKSDKSKGNVLFGVDINLKAAGTMTTGNYTGGTVGLTSWDPMFARVVRRQPFLRQIVTSRPIASKYVAWAEQANPDGGAGATAEGTAKTQADFDIVERNKLVEKITSYIKVSKEALDDISFLRSEIDTELVELLNLKLDADILGANGTSPNIRGILAYATTYDPTAGPTTFDSSIDNANNFDVVRAITATLAYNNYQANYVLINPLDAGLMDMLKVSATDGRYVIPPFYSADGQRIAGLSVITNPGVTAGDFVIGDFSKSNLAIREEINIQVGYENDDFTKNLVTILGELRATHYIKTNHAGAFYKGTFATVKAAMETA